MKTEVGLYRFELIYQILLIRTEVFKFELIYQVKECNQFLSIFLMYNTLTSLGFR